MLAAEPLDQQMYLSRIVTTVPLHYQSVPLYHQSVSLHHQAVSPHHQIHLLLTVVPVDQRVHSTRCSILPLTDFGLGKKERKNGDHLASAMMIARLTVAIHRVNAKRINGLHLWVGCLLKSDN